MSPAAAPRRYYAACRGSDPPQGPARPVSVELGHDEQQRTLLVDAGGTRPCRTGGARGLSPGIDLRGRNALAVPQGRHLARLWRAESGRRKKTRVISEPLTKAAKGRRPFSPTDADPARLHDTT